tara:strand:- start:11953 stop:12375 length:423 start_codon:yes stop_codon:yes gene_type:complete
MKKTILILLTLIFVSCTSDNDDASNNGNLELLGTWKLVEQLVDPGDGSGVFIPITSDRQVEFFSNGTVTVNGVLCDMSSEVGSENSGIYSKLEDNQYYDGQIIPNNCDYSETKLNYKIENSFLIIWYQCIEGCGQKFIKL